MTPPRFYLIVAFAVFIAIALPAAAASAKKPAPINPAEFSSTVDNPYFPLSLVPSRTYEGEEVDPDTGEVITVELTSVVVGTLTVADVETLVLEERSYEDGQLVERALDYFAQHDDGTVYYFGEDVENYENGVFVDNAGTWRAGVDGAQPGIIMPGDPYGGQKFSQENAPGVAEDKARILSLNESVSTPAGDFEGCLKTADWNPLEHPKAVEYKSYCPSIGLAYEEAADGTAFLALTSYTGG